MKTILLSFIVTVFLFANSYYGDIRIKKIEQADKKQITPAIKLVSPRFKIERFFIEEPIESKLIDLFDIGYPLNKDYLLVFPEGITNMGELNKFENDYFVLVFGSIAFSMKTFIGLVSC